METEFGQQFGMFWGCVMQRTNHLLKSRSANKVQADPPVAWIGINRSISRVSGIATLEQGWRDSTKIVR